jgi:hypothetical protein
MPQCVSPIVPRRRSFESGVSGLTLASLTLYMNPSDKSSDKKLAVLSHHYDKAMGFPNQFMNVLHTAHRETSHDHSDTRTTRLAAHR